MRCLLLVLAAARVLLLLCYCCCCCFDDDCSSCIFTFGHISYWHDNSRPSYYCCICLLSVQPPAPASSLAEPPPAASPQLGRWVCHQGLQSARIWGLLLLRRRLPFFAFLRLVTFCTAMTVILLLLLRLQQVRDSHHTAACLGTSS